MFPPAFIRSTILWFVKGSVESRAEFKINDLKPIDIVENIKIPAQFIVANSDTIVDPKQGISLYEKYGGPKSIIKIPGGHNGIRPDYLISSLNSFLCDILLIDKLPGCKILKLENIIGSSIHNVPRIVFPVKKIIRQKNILTKHKEENSEEKNDLISMLLDPEKKWMKK